MTQNKPTQQPADAEVAVKRIYEPVSDSDGQRVLVDRIWPRGVSREAARLEAWLPEVAPSTPLRKWFDHKPERWSEFARRYEQELFDNPHLEQLHSLLSRGRVTLLYSARDIEHNQAVVLAAILTGSTIRP